MNILITGADGFIGKNLSQELSNYSAFKIFKIKKKHSLIDLKKKIELSDVIYHLAGANREKKIKNFKKNNFLFTKQLVDLLKNTKKEVKIIYTSSVLASSKTEYGKTKKSSEIILRELKRNKKISLSILRLPNIFGKWGKPFYNSAIATFCYQASRGQKLELHNNKIITLMYIDDLVQYLIKNMRKKIKYEMINQFNKTYKIKLDKIANLIESFRTLKVEEIPSNIFNEFVKKLYSTYLSYVPQKKIKKNLVKKSDKRGDFVEILKSKSFGQISFVTINPLKERGGHYHNTKIESFFIIQGKVKFLFKNLDTKKNYSLLASQSKYEKINTIPGVVHKIKNIGKKKAILVIWTNEIYNKDKPDTYNYK